MLSSVKMIARSKSVKIVIGLFVVGDLLYSIFLAWQALSASKKSKLVEEKEVIPPEVAPIKSKPQRKADGWYRHLPRIDFRQQPAETLWNTVLFFPEIFPEQEFSQTHQLMWYMQQAERTLDVAIYHSNFRLLEDVLFDMARKKVRVRVVTNGVQVREKPKIILSPHGGGLLLDHMHNKFIVIDDKAILTGSLNWTNSAITENRESMVVTNDAKTVGLYTEEFQKLWEMSDPSVKRDLIHPPKIGQWYGGRLL
ncbi:Mitochondrial cardiolipin hydrolase [Folsomia candida]|uniref:Mitochondrial cardiolipin hydrolase n=1 Tax=Folsomia candida TaxID=158441 RepID=A0A226E6W3_FOLCA|nr:Mitochondrial cardiolipin hydrolase [Folsomia candida]